MFIAGASAEYPQFGVEYAYRLTPTLFIGTGLNILAYQPDFSTLIARRFFDEIGFNAQIPPQYQDYFVEDNYSKFHNESSLGYEIPIFLNYCPRVWLNLHWHFTPAFAVRGLWSNPQSVEDFLADESGNLLKILEVAYNIQPSIGWRFETGPSWHLNDRHFIGIHAIVSNVGVNIMEGNYRLLPNQPNERNGQYRFEGSYFGLQIKYAVALPY